MHRLSNNTDFRVIPGHVFIPIRPQQARQIDALNSQEGELPGLGIHLHGQNWVNLIEECGKLVRKLMRLNRNK